MCLGALALLRQRRVGAADRSAGEVHQQGQQGRQQGAGSAGQSQRGVREGVREGLDLGTERGRELRARRSEGQGRRQAAERHQRREQELPERPAAELRLHHRRERGHGRLPGRSRPDPRRVRQPGRRRPVHLRHESGRVPVSAPGDRPRREALPRHEQALGEVQEGGAGDRQGSLSRPARPTSASCSSA